MELVVKYAEKHRSWAKPVLAACVAIRTDHCNAVRRWHSELSDRRRRGAWLHAYGAAPRGVDELSRGSAGDAGHLLPDVAAAKQIVTTAIADRRQCVDHKWMVCSCYDITMVPTYAAADVEQTVAYADEIFAQGATVVLKIMSRDIVHKSDVGGVVLNLTSPVAVRAAAVDILARARKLRPEARIDGVIVQAMVVKPKARELILGIADDPIFGTVVVFGRGGTAVEIINDEALALPPLDLQLARDLIERTRVSRLLPAYRDVPAVKQDAVALVLVELAQMAADPEIGGLDLDTAAGDETGVTAVDARVAVGPPRRKFAGSGPAPISPSALIRRNGSAGSHSRTAGASPCGPCVPRARPCAGCCAAFPARSPPALLRANEGVHPRLHRAP